MFESLSQNAGKVSQDAIFSVQERLGSFLDGLKIANHPFFFLDILLVALLIYWFWMLIRRTRALRILYGIIILAVLMLVGQLLNLTTLNWILKYLLTMLVVAIPVVFQPELRSALERIGKTKFMGDFAYFSRQKAEQIIDEIIDACLILKGQKKGALIVIRRNDLLEEYLDSGVEVNAKVSKEMLLSIFSENSPLHDGAVIVSGNTILKAGVMLPLDSDVEDYQLGARHKAAVAITKLSDAISIVVSEERKVISLCIEGKIEADIESEELKYHLLNQLTKKMPKVNPAALLDRPNQYPQRPTSQNQHQNQTNYQNQGNHHQGQQR